MRIVSLTCPTCGREYETTVTRIDRRKRCPTCVDQQKRARERRRIRPHAAPRPPREADFRRTYLCLQDTSGLYRPGYEYAGNFVNADIRAGLVSADCFKKLPQRWSTGAGGQNA